MFKIGDQVTWTSQAGGHTATKEGAIFEIVAAGEKPAAKLKQPGFPRDHESYVVRGVRMSGSKGVQNYWPVVKNLRPKNGLVPTHPVETAAKQWEVTVQEELRRARASGDAIATQMAEWGVKIVTAIIAGEAPKPG